MRGMFDRNRMLWCGWVVASPSARKFYYTGDTGFCEKEFPQIGAQLGPFDLAAVSIGCYAPKDFMGPQHMDLAESVRVHQMVRARRSVGIHWGTYDMGSWEPYMEPRTKLREEVEKAGLKPDDFFTLEHGETWAIEAAGPD